MNDITNKQRAYLSGLAVNEKAILELGKSTVTPEFTAALDEALEKRELVKITVLKNCDLDINDAASTLAARTKSKVVRVIGRKIVFYRPAKKPVIVLPKG